MKVTRVNKTRNFLKNAWYAAAWADEVTDNLFERKIIGDPILIYRKADGEPVAVHNACPHRLAPLHMGKKIGSDIIECAYHGLRFNSEGKCVHNPHSEKTPSKMCLRSYPVVERHDLIWIWMGEKELANAETIPDFSCHTDSKFKTVKGVMHMAGNYELIADNLMDLTHVEYLHEGLLGSEAISRGTHKIKKEGTTIWSNRWCPDGLAPPAWDMLFKDYGKNVDHWLYMRWDAPAHMLLDVGVTPVGRPRDEGVYMYGTDILTPADEENTYYFWGASRSHDQDDPHYDEVWKQAIEVAFGKQDRPMIEAQQKMIKSLGGVDIDDLQPVLLPSDIGPVQIRKALRDLVRDQNNEQADSRGVPNPANIPLQQLLKDDTGRYVDRVEPIV